jgi:hypothetical protein
MNTFVKSGDFCSGADLSYIFFLGKWFSAEFSSEFLGKMIFRNFFREKFQFSPTFLKIFRKKCTKNRPLVKTVKNILLLVKRLRGKKLSRNRIFTKDEFWHIFLSLWCVTMSVAFQTTRALIPGLAHFCRVEVFCSFKKMGLLLTTWVCPQGGSLSPGGDVNLFVYPRPQGWTP